MLLHQEKANNSFSYQFLYKESSKIENSNLNKSRKPINTSYPVSYLPKFVLQ